MTVCHSTSATSGNWDQTSCSLTSTENWHYTGQLSGDQLASVFDCHITRQWPRWMADRYDHPSHVTCPRQAINSYSANGLPAIYTSTKVTHITQEGRSHRLSMALKNQPLNRLSWVAANCDSSCSLAFSWRRLNTSSSNNSRSRFSYTRPHHHHQTTPPSPDHNTISSCRTRQQTTCHWQDCIWNRDRISSQEMEKQRQSRPIGLDCAVFYVPRQHSIGYMGDGFYRSKEPTNSIKVLVQFCWQKCWPTFVMRSTHTI